MAGVVVSSEDVKALALALGFDRAGVAPASPGPHADFLREWLARGYDGEMGWIGRRAEERMDPRAVLPGARSVVAVGLVYDPATPELGGPVSAGRIARYAGGDDYHELLKSDLADVKNIGGRWGGAITAAKFLENFVNETPWVHLDIAGPAYAESGKPHQEGGGSGKMVHTLVETVSQLK